MSTTITKRDLCWAVAKGSSQPYQATSEVISAFLSALTTALANGRRVEIRGLGSFHPRRWAGRKVRRPGEDKAVKVPSSMTVSFKPGRALKGMR